MPGSSVRRFALGAALALAPVVVAAQSGQPIQLTVADGRVTLITENASPRDILAEWTRVTGTEVVGTEHVAGSPLTLRLENVSERQALDAVLRSAAGGYMAADSSILIVPARPGQAAEAPAVARQTPRNRTRTTVAAEPVAVEEYADPDEAMYDSNMGMDVGFDGEGEDVQADWAAGSNLVLGSEDEAGDSSTEFDYANPQRYFQMRAEQMRQLQMERQQMQGGEPIQPGGVVLPGQGVTAQSDGGASIVGGGAQSSTPPGQPAAPGLADRPGMQPAQPATPAQPGQQGQPNPQNPYGLPDGVIPGSQAPPPGSPAYDGRRFNPYEPSSTPAGQAAGQQGSGNSSSEPDQP